MTVNEAIQRLEELRDTNNGDCKLVTEFCFEVSRFELDVERNVVEIT